MLVVELRGVQVYRNRDWEGKREAATETIVKGEKVKGGGIKLK